MAQAYTFEKLGEHARLCISREHRFGTDAFLLSDFASPRRRDLVCDLGAGCGIVGALWFRTPQDAPKHVWAVEIQEQAVAQMHMTLENGGLPKDRFTPIKADLRSLKGILPAGTMDVVTCNPPYKVSGTGILSQSGSDQIARHETLCSMDDVCHVAARLLRFNGRLCICQRPERLADAIVCMRMHGIEPKRLRFVHQRPERAPWLFLLEGCRGGRAHMRVEPPLIVEGEGGFSREMLRIYQKEANR